MSAKGDLRMDRAIRITLVNTQSELSGWFAYIGEKYKAAKLNSRFSRREHFVRKMAAEMQSFYAFSPNEFCGPVQNEILRTVSNEINWKGLSSHILDLYEQRTNQHEPL